MRILFVEDSERLQTYVAEGLRQAGCAVDAARDGEQGLWAAENAKYDVIVLDIKLPRLDGLTLLQRLRDQGNTSSTIYTTNGLSRPATSSIPRFACSAGRSRHRGSPPSYKHGAAWGTC